MASRYEKQAKKYIDPYRKKAVGDALELYQEEAKDTRKYYDTQIFEEGRAYEDEYRANAVQKAINERQVAESMANMGITDSGLNRTQQTAINLSYANNKANIDRAKRQAIDNIELQKTNDLSTIRKSWLAERNAINQSYDQAEADYANDLYGSAYKGSGGGSVSKDQTKYKIRSYGGNGIDESGNQVYYFYDENGSKKTYPAGINPYTGQPITGGYTAEDIEGYGGVWNGYQPKGVKYGGYNFGKVTKYESPNGSAQIAHQGHYKTVWKTSDGSLWVWDDEVGNYVRAWDNGDGTFSYESY